MRKENKGALLGAAASWLYFRESESGQDKTANCSYLAPVSTDVAAVGAAAILYQQARKGSNFWVGLVAGAIAGIHAQQFAHYKSQSAVGESVSDCEDCHFEYEEREAFPHLPVSVAHMLQAEHDMLRKNGFPPDAVREHAAREMDVYWKYVPQSIVQRIEADHKKLLPR